jgi:hypothetical protein
MPTPQPLRLDVKPLASLTGDERAALAALTAAVYPPDASAASPGRHVRWASLEHSVLVWGPTGELVSHVGVLVRAGTLDGAPVTVGGIGSVKTHPAAEGRGYASAGLRRAAAVLHDDHHAAFSLLVCQDHLVAFYQRLGWQLFGGDLLVEQPAGRTRFTINRVMVLTARRACPRAGVIDLEGLPW